MATVPPDKARTPLVLTLDIGSSSVRASLYDYAANMVEGLEIQEKYHLDTHSDGSVSKDAEELLKIVTSCIDNLFSQCDKNLHDKICAVAIDTFWHSLMGIDGDGKALTPVFTWADTRSSDQARQLRHDLDEKAVHSRTGCLLHPSYFPAKLLWLAANQPDVYKQATRWVSFAEYLYIQLFGDACVSVSMASGTGLFDQFTQTWDDELLDYLKLSKDKLSSFCDMNQPQQKLKAEYAHRWPMLAQIPWYPAIGDGAAGNLGSGCFSPDRIAVMVGTSGAMRVVLQTDKVKIPFGLWCYRVDKKRLVLGGALSEGGNLFAWMEETLQLPSKIDLEAALQAMEPDCHGLTVLPFLTGERSPGWNGAARAAITGLSLNTQPVDILRAGLESVCYRFGMIHELLQPEVPQAKEVVASGGALLSSPAWTQILTDVLNRPVRASAERETSSRGVALLVLEQLGAFGDNGLEAAAYDFEHLYQPDPERHHRYTAAMERQRELYQSIIKPES